MEGEDPQHLSLELDESEFETNPTSDKNNIDSDENQENKLRFYQQSAETELLQEKRIKSGYLKKKGVQRKTWKRRWFVLFPSRLCYYNDEQEYETLNIIMTNKIHSCAYIETKKRPFVFGIITKERTFYMQAENHSEMESWISTIRSQLISTLNISTIPGSQAPSTTTPSFPVETGISRPSDVASVSILSVATTPLAAANAPSQSMIALSPIDLPSLPGSPLMSHNYSLVSKVTSNVVTASPLVRTWGTDHDDESEEEPNIPLSAVLQKIPGDDIIHASGYLYKLKHGLGGVKIWKKLYFVLRNGKLISYKDDTEYEVLRLLPLDIVLDILDIDPLKYKQKTHQYCFKLIFSQKSWILCSETEQDRTRWMSQLQMVRDQVRLLKDN